MKKILILLLISGIFAFGCKKEIKEDDGTITSALPIANAGKLQSVIVGTNVTLDGSLSNSNASKNLTFNWGFINVPNGSAAVLNDISNSHPSFTADMEGTYKIKLVINDGYSSSLPDTVVVISSPTNGNAPPVAHAGHDQTIHLGTTVLLDGTASTDANGHALSYIWSIKSKPSSSASVLSSNNVANPVITPDVEGNYVIQLIVNDGISDSQADEVVIIVQSMSMKQQLMAMNLTDQDADFLIANHLSDVQAVLAQNDRIFKGVPSLSTMFALPTDPGAAVYNDPLMTTWSQPAMDNFTKAFGRIAFVINTPKFQQSFDANINLLNPAYQGTTPWIPYPTSYAQFRASLNSTLLSHNYLFKFYVSNRASWVAYGSPWLNLKVENIMLDPSQALATAPHNGEALILHELMHSLGYAHDAADQNLVINHPNNLPYFVQYIVGVDYLDPTAPMMAYTANALLTIYFGNP